METFGHTFLIDHMVAIKDEIFSKTNQIFPSTFTAQIIVLLILT